jgi:regulator of sigma E protease
VGLQAGDRIVAVDSTQVTFWQQMATRIQAAEGRPVRLRWQRPDSLARQGDAPTRAALVATTAEGMRVYEATAAPRYDAERGRYFVGVGPPTGPDGQRFLAALYGAKTERYGPGDALAAGARDTWSNAVTIVVSLKRIFVGRDDLRENLGGPVKIAEVTSQAAAAGARYFWQIVAILSITLAIMNMLPIPALDGGQLVFLLYEGITRRKPSVRVRLVAQQIGMILLIGFMAFLIFNDIMRL